MRELNKASTELLMRLTEIVERSRDRGKKVARAKIIAKSKPKASLSRG